MASGRLQVPQGAAHLDTVRSLHQTVVSLRTALEVSKNELRELKQKYEQHSNCLEYADVIEKLTVENHILRRKIIDSGLDDREASENIKLKVSNVEECVNNQLKAETTTSDNNKEVADKSVDLDEISNYSPSERLENIQEENSKSSITDIESPRLQSDISEEPKSQITVTEDKGNIPSYKTKLELLSKFDVKIKVRTLKEGNISTTASETDSSENQKKEGPRKESQDSQASFQFKEKKEHFDNFIDLDGNELNFKTVSKENIKMAVPNEAEVKSKVDKFDVQVRITSEENLVVKESTERLRRKDTLNLDVDDLSLRSLSEGDNSVFSEGGTTPMEPRPPDDREDASGNESEEVDDIELIFTTDESKDISNLQEDLVSIRDSEQWVPNSASTIHSTPVLIKFHTLDPDFQPGERPDNVDIRETGNEGVIGDSFKQKRVSLPNDKEIKQVAFNGKGSLDLPGRGILKSCGNKSDNMLYKRSPNTSTRRLDSVDSLTCEYNRGLSFDNTKSSSFELGSSMDILNREESVDSFHKTGRFGHRFSLFAETDISKCGISEDDLASNFNIRRNTCPNPFQYRPLPYRGTIRGGKPVTSSRRPVLRESCGPRRESAAQTDMSALPPRWTSDGYLAYKSSSRVLSCPTTVPQRVTSRRVAQGGARAPPPTRRGHRTDDARRVLLSDIGFTSMVPELSRSAEPLWNLRRTAPDSPQPRHRGVSYRSPCLSIDRSNDWSSNTKYTSTAKGEYRAWRGSLPDVRNDDTEELLQEAETFLRRSIDNITIAIDEPGCVEPGREAGSGAGRGQPYVPGEARQLRLGHAVKLITPQGRLAVGRVRYVGIAGGSAANSGVVVGAEFSQAQYPGLPSNDGTYRGRRYFLAPPHYTAMFVPFSKVVMAWAN
ncbi:PREDICTED: uncharacterized protein LOC106105074 [Papilio polytes]|uniref:uncharacterized protein LOC106105074 n=1 Tax=Papilio polytes TaxID=76194 RepID=UPI0006760158|nr:PREDICTED: uncharacterized protein LOC106105074 [Papilio polytes]